MRRFRNPRYAPEPLERKLSPSGMVGLPVAAVVHIPSTQTSIVSPTVSNPTIAAASARSTVVVIPTSGARSSSLPVALADPTGPSTPTPSPVPSGGTEPAPPPSNGTPPWDIPLPPQS